jgi:hypothetical protein
MSMTDDDHGMHKAGDNSDLLYDFFKWITSLSLLTIGGSLSLLQAANIAPTKSELIMILAPLAVAAITGLQCASEMVRLRVSGKKPFLPPMVSVSIAMLALGMGTGIFVMTFVSSLSK